MRVGGLGHGGVYFEHHSYHDAMGGQMNQGTVSDENNVRRVGAYVWVDPQHVAQGMEVSRISQSQHVHVGSQHTPPSPGTSPNMTRQKLMPSSADTISSTKEQCEKMNCLLQAKKMDQMLSSMALPQA